MKFNLAVLAVAVPVLLAATPAAARDDAVNTFQIANVTSREDFQSQTQGVRFYFGDQATPAVARRVEANATTSQRTRKFGRTAEEACQWVMMSALLRLRDHALAVGANGVVNIRSNWQNNEWSSTTEYQCGIGGIMAGVALKADIVTFR